MKFNAALGLLALVGGASSSLTITTNTNKNPLVSNQNTTVVPNTFIVELQPDFHPDLQPKERFAKTAPGAKVGYRVRQQYNSSDFFYGVSVSFNTHVDLGTLRQSTGVKNAWKVAIVPRPEPYHLRGAPKISQGTSLPNLRGSAKVNQPLAMSNVQKLHDQGIKGKGVQVAIIDTGVDYRHPALGGGFGRGHKIALGYDFVGDDYDGSNTPVPDPDPLATCVDGGHGTHTAGIVGMEDPDNVGFGLVGVAPEATLASYRVFGCEGSTSNELIISAFLKAAQDGADVVSISIGGYDIWEEINPFDEVITRLTNHGVAVVAAIGNFGTAGVFSTAAPGISTNALSVGSIENEVYPTVYTAHDDKHKAIDYVSVFPATGLGRVEVYQLGTGLDVPIDANVSSGCYEPAWDALAAASVDWNNTILLVSWVSWCGTAWGTAVDLGAQAILVYQPEELLIVVDEPEDPTTLLYLDYNNSQQIVNNLAQLPAGQKYYLTFDGKKPSSAADPLGRTPDEFSSFGPTVEMSLAPKVSAPGGTILATWPLEAGGYAVLSGTSMATPFTAGSLALLKSQQPHLSVAELYARLMTTAGPVNEPNSKQIASTARQGGGLIDVYAAVKADTVISPSELSLHDSETPAPRKITITNQSKSRKKYSFQHSPGSFYRVYYNYLTGNTDYNGGSEVIPLDVPASASFSQSSLTLGPGQSATVQIQIKPQHDDWPWSLPVYGGFVKIISDDAAYSIPYIGVPYNRTEVGPIMHNVTTQLPYDSPGILKLPANDLFLADGQIPTPNIDSYNWSTDPSKSFIPVFRVDVLLPSRFIRFDLVPANVSFVPSIYGFDPDVHIDYEPPSQAILPGFLGVPTYGQLFSITVDDAPSNSPTLSQPLINHFFAQALLLPTLTNDDNVSYNISSGDYRPLLRALRWNGNETNPDDYESWLGPVIRADIPSDEFPTET
ncbi:peptidase S8/S53 domain-containing protein [Trichoderma sp. SZMC 28011]